MATEQVLISGIAYKVRKLIEKNQTLSVENNNLTQQVETLKSNLEKLAGELEVKRNEIFKFTLANAYGNEFGVEESKIKIDELIKEIDNCIRVLSE